MRKFLLVPALFISCSLLADIAVVVHPANSAKLDPAEIAKLYLGRSKSFSDGSAAVPLAQAESATATPIFNEKILNKTGSQMKAYWSKLVFTGKGTPPQELLTDKEVIDLVSKNPNMIGYVDRGAVTADVKVVASL
jgi:ABC-type phosphate transport system substrate-binding protein